MHVTEEESWLHPRAKIAVLMPAVQTSGLLQSASDFMTSGDESGGGKSGAQRRRTVKDKPRKPRMKPEGDAEGDAAVPGTLCLGFRVTFRV